MAVFGIDLSDSKIRLKSWNLNLEQRKQTNKKETIVNHVVIH